jgi:hypothetical protein
MNVNDSICIVCVEKEKLAKKLYKNYILAISKSPKKQQRMPTHKVCLGGVPE